MMEDDPSRLIAAANYLENHKMPTPKADRPDLRPEGFKGVKGNTVPAPRKPQPQPTGPYKPGNAPGNNGEW